MAKNNYPNSGSMFKEKKYVAGGKHPYMTGYIDLASDMIEEINAGFPGPVRIRVAAWVVNTDNGTFLSIKASPNEQKPEPRRRQAPRRETDFLDDEPRRAPRRERDLDDDIPF